MKRAIIVILILLLIALAIGYYRISLESEMIQNKIWYNISIAINVIFVLTIISVIYTIIRDNNDPIITIAWLQILVFLPIVGFILYILFGINHRKRKMFRNKAILDVRRLKRIAPFVFQQELSNDEKIKMDKLRESRIVKMLYNNNNAHLTLNNRINTYFSGKATNEAIFEHLAKAKHHIHMEYFSINDDQTGRILQKIFIEKAKQGVEVRLIYDAVGCWRLQKSFLQPLADCGVQTIPFLPVTLPVFSSKLNYRNHRKIIIIDGVVGFLGGVNIADKYMGEDKYFGHWRDTHVKLEGDVVYSLQKSFLVDWKFLTKEKLKLECYFPKHNISNLLPMQIVASGPDSSWENIMQAYFSAIAGAKEKIYITSPYLVLNESLLIALKTAALSGLDVRIILPGRPDHKIVFYGTRSYYEELLEAGVRIYQYNAGFIHAKVILVDNLFVSIGSANMDIRSFKQNFEINSIIYDSAYFKILENYFMDDINNSYEIILEEFKKRKSSAKVFESFSRLVSPLL